MRTKAPDESNSLTHNTCKAELLIAQQLAVLLHRVQGFNAAGVGKYNWKYGAFGCLRKALPPTKIATFRCNSAFPIKSKVIRLCV